jgi:2-C-methyl-D-erythritol 4-phosphate cytidylyltransferase
MTKTAIILGGGDGRRAGGSAPKQFRNIGGEMVLMRAIKAFFAEDINTRVLVVIHPGFLYEWEEIINQLCVSTGRDIKLICGGKSRFHSVYNAIMEVTDDANELVAIHDGARPLITEEMIKRGWETGEKTGAAVPAIPPTNSLRKLNNDGSNHAVIRSEYVEVQTPQVFRADILKRAYQQPENAGFTDDASVVEALGYKVSLYEGDSLNIKITNPLDFRIAELILADRSKTK